MIPREVLRNIRRIQIVTSRMVEDVFAGQYHSVFKGRGMEFEEVRQYQPGDEIRSIDWNVTARMGTPYVKKFVEERELVVMFLLDLSSSCYFGTVRKLKSQLAAEICSVLAFSAIKNNDKVGLIIFTDRIEKVIPPRKGTTHVLRIIREALYFKPQGSKTNISGAIDYLNRITHRRTVTFIISDFYDEGFKKNLTVAARRHDIIAVTLTDPRELDMPDVGIIELEDAETADIKLIDTSLESCRDKYRKNAFVKIKERDGLLRSCGIDVVDVRTDYPYERALYTFFKMREKRKIR